MTEPKATVTEITIHSGSMNAPGALVLQLAPAGDFLILRQDEREIELDGADLPVLLREGMRLLEQGKS